MKQRFEQKNKGSTRGKKEWRKPQVRAVVPASHTRGGAAVFTSEDPIFYRIS